MSKKRILIACLVIVSMFIGVASLFAQQVPRASGAIRNTLRGMNIVVGNWWEDYDTTRMPPTMHWIGSDSQERQLDYRRRLLQEYNFTMVNRNIGGWSEIPQVAATSIMAGRPAADVFVLQADWALSLYRQNLLFPVSTSRAVNWTATTPVEWNRHVTQAFTFGRNAYAFADGYGGSMQATVLFWNKRLFREAGVNVTVGGRRYEGGDILYDLQRDNHWNWETFLTICKQLTRDINNDGIIDIYAMPSDLSTEILDAFVSSNSAMYVDRDRHGRLVNATGRPEFVAAVRYFMRLRDEGVMMPRPEGSPWNWHIPAFNDGNVAIRIDQHYVATNDMRHMRDDWGMVLPPRGPNARSRYVVFNNEHVMVMPARGRTPAQVDAILWAVQAWIIPVDADWRIAMYPSYRDRRAVDETNALIRDQRLWQWRYHLHVPGLNRGGIAWEIWWHDGEPAQLIEAVSQNWNALIEDANSLE